VSIDLLRSHIGKRANGGLRTERGTAVRQGRQPKVAEQYLLLPTQEHILRFDIAMDEIALVCVLQGSNYLLDKGDDLGKRNDLALWIAPPQGAARSIVHHQIGHTILYIKSAISVNSQMPTMQKKTCSKMRN